MVTQLDEAVLVALGSNMEGDHASSRALLEAALEQFEGFGLRLLACSGWWRSAAWPDSSHPDYLNGLAIVETALGPHETLSALRDIEVRFGRVRARPNDPRTLDLDLIAHGRTLMETPDLILPHPRAAGRLFVMGPLAQIAPGWRHPVLGVTAAELAQTATVGLDATPV
jgi:2-amino-4-hydroxy-6-hydroxymethyldihydropteridine diphosphokinase